MRAYEGCYKDGEWDEASVGASFWSYPPKNTDEALVGDALRLHLVELFSKVSDDT
jgi:hypothetical protein